MPVDKEPVAWPDGKLLLVDDVGTIRVYTATDKPAAAPVYRSHFVTCPHGGDWRRRR